MSHPFSSLFDTRSVLPQNRSVGMHPASQGTRPPTHVSHPGSPLLQKVSPRMHPGGPMPRKHAQKEPNLAPKPHFRQGIARCCRNPSAEISRCPANLSRRTPDPNRPRFANSQPRGVKTRASDISCGIRAIDNTVRLCFRRSCRLSTFPPQIGRAHV